MYNQIMRILKKLEISNLYYLLILVGACEIREFFVLFHKVLVKLLTAGNTTETISFLAFETVKFLLI